MSLRAQSARGEDRLTHTITDSAKDQDGRGPFEIALYNVVSQKGTGDDSCDSQSVRYGVR